MKIVYEKYDDTVQYLNDDKVDGWEPTAETITVESNDQRLVITTQYAGGEVHSNEMMVIDESDGRQIAQSIDEHMGITVFVHSPNQSEEATLTVINDNYIVGRYLRRVK